MAYTLGLRCSGYTGDTYTINFLSMNYALEESGLSIGAPEKKQLWAPSISRQTGDRLISSEWGNREIEITFRVSGSTIDSLADNIHSLEQMLIRARGRSILGSGNRTSLEYKRDAASNSAYFEVFDGELTYPSDFMGIEHLASDTSLGGYFIWGMKLKLTVSPFGYSVDCSYNDPTLSSIPLTSTSQTDVTNGITVRNHLDRANTYLFGYAYDNVVWIKDDAIDGDAPAICPWWFVVQDTETDYVGTIHIGVMEDEEKNFPFFELYDDADADVIKTGYTAYTGQTTESNDTYTRVVLTETTEQTLFQWDYSTNDVNPYATIVRAFGRTKTGTYWDQNALFRLHVLGSDGTTILYSTEWRQAPTTTTTLFDFGSFPLPLWNLGFLTGSYQQRSIRISGKRLSAGTTNLDFDYLNLLPIRDGYRVVKVGGSGITQGSSLWDNPFRSTPYYRGGTGEYLGNCFGLLRPLELKPKTKYGIHLLWEGVAGASQPSRPAWLYIYKIERHGILI